MLKKLALSCESPHYIPKRLQILARLLKILSSHDNGWFVVAIIAFVYSPMKTFTKKKLRKDRRSF